MTLGNKTLDDLLAPITEQLGHAHVPELLDPPTWKHEPKRAANGMSADELVSCFTAEAEKIRVQVKRCQRGELASCVAGIVASGTPHSGEPCSVVCADDERFAQAGLYEAVAGQQLVSKLSVWGQRGNADRDIADALAATYGITYADAGIAETATVAQPTSVRCGRAISLLPLVHIAVVDAATIVPTMREVLETLGRGAELPSQLCFISGPSATADIELVRVEGVHGPMYVHYVIVE